MQIAMGILEQFAQRTFSDETKLITGNAVEWQDPPEIRLEKVQSDGFLVIRDPRRLAHLAPPWPAAQMHGEVMVELKLVGNHLDREQVERGLLRRQARQVQRVAEQDPDWLGEEPLWLVAPHLPAWLHEMRRPASFAAGCYWIEPQWHRFVWIAANELPLHEELIPFLLARSGQKLDEFAKWVAARRPVEWMMTMLEYLPMSTLTQEELLARFGKVDDPEIEARRQRILQHLLNTSPQVKEQLLREGREEGRMEGREEGRMEGREEGREEGRMKGREEGRAEALDAMRTTLRRLIARRQLPLSERDDARIQACADLATLQRWLDRAIVASSTSEALE